ncbi:MAG: hypothetical protein AAF737_04310 [Pseudomonadota bacterium]
MHHPHFLLGGYRFACVLAATACLAGCVQTSDEMFAYAKKSEAFERAGKPISDQSSIALFEQAAQAETNPARRGEKYRALGDAYERRGQLRSAYAAYETGAIAGDRRAGSKILRAHSEGKYRPQNVTALAQNVYVKQVETDNSVRAALLMAELTESGAISKATFGQPDVWLQRAAASGSIGAKRQLAQRVALTASAAAATRAYLATKPNSTGLQYALRNAKDFYQGTNGKPSNRGKAVEWLTYAAGLSRKEAGKTAWSLHRKSPSGRYGKQMVRIAARGGIDVNRRRGSSVLAAYRNATTDAERAQALEGLRNSADRGDTQAALAVAKALAEGGKGGEALPYYTIAARTGDANTVSATARLVATSNGTASDRQGAVDRLTSLADNGNLTAIKALASLYGSGGAVRRDLAASRKYYGKAAAKGDTNAQLQYGLLLARGAGGPKDVPAARENLQKAASAGSSAAAAALRSLPQTS